jgi:hypothetical protein
LMNIDSIDDMNDLKSAYLELCCAVANRSFHGNSANLN